LIVIITILGFFITSSTSHNSATFSRMTAIVRSQCTVGAQETSPSLSGVECSVVLRSVFAIGSTLTYFWFEYLLVLGCPVMEVGGKVDHEL